MHRCKGHEDAHNDKLRLHEDVLEASDVAVEDVCEQDERDLRGCVTVTCGGICVQMPLMPCVYWCFVIVSFRWKACHCVTLSAWAPPLLQEVP